MITYGHYDFEELLKDEDNLVCFDCGKTPAQWASVNNAIYLCITCSGSHRGYGVSTSYVRSITLDTWNDNQISLMKAGGNKNCKELLDIYGIDRLKVDKLILYNSRLMDFYRRYLKSKVNNQPFDKQVPGKEEALKGLSLDTYAPIPDSSKYSSVSTNGTTSFKSVSASETSEEDSSFIGALNTWMAKAFDSTKYIANKVGEMEIGTKIISTGSVITETGGTLLDKGTEAAKSATVQSFAKKANQTLNFLVSKIFGSGKRSEESSKEEEQPPINTNDGQNETAKIDLNNEVKFDNK